MLVDVQYIAGTQKSPQQTKLSMMAFTDTNHVHFPDGKLRTIPAYAEVANNVLDSVDFTGACRSVWAAQLSGTNEGFYQLYGCNNRLYVRNNGSLYNITPLKTVAATTLGTNPVFALYDGGSSRTIETTSGSNLVTVDLVNITYAKVGDQVVLSGFAGLAVGGLPAVTFNGTFTILTIALSLATIRVGATASSTASRIYGSINEALKKIGLIYTAHGLSVGDRIKVSGCSGAVGGVPAIEINGEHIVDIVPSADRVAFRVTTTPTSDTAGGGAAVQIFKQIDGGNLDQNIATGYGVGEYGAALYGQGGVALNAELFPRIWSFGNFGNEIVMCPGDYTAGDGQKIFIWDGDIATAPTILTNSPTDCNWVTVVNNSVVALCGRAVKICESGDATVWSGITYYEKTLERVWKLVSCFNINEKEAVIFTPTEAISLKANVAGELWDLSDLYVDDGILAPQCACLNGISLGWKGARGFYRYDGSPVVKMSNPQNEDYTIEQINYGKAWKSFVTVDSQNAEWWFLYPTGTDTEPNDYSIINPTPMEGLTDGYVALGQIARTAAQRPGFVNSQFQMVNAYSESTVGTIYRHFINGASTFSSYAKTAISYVDKGDARWMVDQFVPDSNQSGDISLQIGTREWPQSTETLTSAYTVSSNTPYLTVKAAGKLFTLEFSGTTQWTLGNWKMNIGKLGRQVGNAV